MLFLYLVFRVYKKPEKTYNSANIVGIDDVRDTPVPIPNTEVKPNGAKNTWLETAWKNREMPT